MKRKILFVMESLRIGGAEKSLVTLLSQLDYSKYEVDLFLFRSEGEFMNLIPSEVNLLETPEDFTNFISSPIDSINYLYKNKKWKLLIVKIMELIPLSVSRFIFNKEYIGWKYIKQSIKTLPNEYDVAIGFLEKKSIYFTVDRVISKKKIGWIHIDYEKIDYNHKLDSKYFGYLDDIITVSDHCRDVLVDKFQRCKGKVKVIQNIISPKLINYMSEKDIEDLNFLHDDIIICTVCRLTIQKGIDIAIECCEELIKMGFKLKWIVIGEGEERERLNKLISQKGLDNIFILMGSRSNPYPYMRRCDIYVQPSRWEGFGITVAEAKVLLKPILVSNIPEFREQIKDNYTGFIYENLNEMIDKLKMLLVKYNKRQLVIENLKKINMNNYNEIKKIERILEE